MNERSGSDVGRLESGSGMTVRDLIALLSARKAMIGLCALAGLAVSLAVVLLVPAQWEAMAVVRLGQVGHVQADSGQSLLESPARALERLKLRPFQDAVLNRLQIPSDDSDRRARLYRASLKPKVIPNADLIEIRVRGPSREDALAWAAATIEYLSEVHGRLAEASLRRLKVQLQNAQKALERAEAERTRLLEQAPARQRGDDPNDFAEQVLRANLIASKDAEIARLRDATVLLEEQLSPSWTYPTAALESVTVPERAAFPNPWLLIPLATLAGLIIGMLLAIATQGGSGSAGRSA